MIEKQFKEKVNRLREICKNCTEASAFDLVVEYYTIGRELLKERLSVQKLPVHPWEKRIDDAQREREIFFSRLEAFVCSHHNQTPLSKAISLDTLYFGWIGYETVSLAYARDYSEESCRFTAQMLCRFLRFQLIYLNADFFDGPLK